MKERSVVACGGAVATSTIANKVVELGKNGIEIDICQVRISKSESNTFGNKPHCLSL